LIKNKSQTQISDSDPRLMYLYKTLDIIKMIKDLESNENVDKERLEEFLEIVPSSSNYLIERYWKNQNPMVNLQ